jgi:hypothetical protein
LERAGAYSQLLTNQIAIVAIVTIAFHVGVAPYMPEVCAFKEDVLTLEECANAKRTRKVDHNLCLLVYFVSFQSIHFISFLASLLCVIPVHSFHFISIHSHIVVR